MGPFHFSAFLFAMEQTGHKKQTVTMEVIESAITSHRSIVSTWLEKSSKGAEKSNATKYNKTMQSYSSLQGAVEQAKHNGQADHQRAYSRLGIGAKPGAASGTSDSLQMKGLRGRIMKQSGNSPHSSSHRERSSVVDKSDEMESRDKVVERSKKRRL